MLFVELAAERAPAGGLMTYPGDMKNWREPALLRRWHKRIAMGRIEELVLAPGDLRTPEVGFLEEVQSGSIGLVGETLTFSDGSPFEAISPSRAYARELHGFGWLRHFQANRADEVESVALRLMTSWIAAGGRAQTVACEPMVTARRVLSWLAHGNIALQNAPLPQYDAIMDALAEDLSWLDRRTSSLAPGIERLFCELALLEAAMCRGFDAKNIARYEGVFFEDLARQFKSDGLHTSRSPAASIELLLDLVPLRQMYAARHVPAPNALTNRIERMLLALARLRLGDGAVARFHGMGATVLEQVAVLLGGCGSSLGHGSTVMADAGYARLEAGKTTLIADVGAPPPSPWRPAVAAAPLAFELSLGRALLVCNAGADGNYDTLTPPQSSASVSTLTLGSDAAPTPISDTADAGGSFNESDDSTTLEAFHDGYRVHTGLVHQRRLTLSKDGRRLEGRDRLAGKPERLAAGVPYRVRFRLHPSVRVDVEPNGEVRLAAANGMRARFKAEQGVVSIEPATFHAGVTKAQACMAIVVHARTDEADTIDWQIAVGV